MLVLGTGQSTGRVVASRRFAGVLVTTTQHASNEYETGTHYHEHPHLCLLLQGADLESRGSLPYPREVGQVFFYHAGEPHATVASDGPSRHANIEFDEAFLRTHGVTEPGIETAIRTRRDAAFLVIRIQSEARRGDDVSPLAIESLLLELVGPAPADARTRPRWVQEVDTILHDRWNQQLSLRELSVATGTRPVTISKHFRRYFAATLGDYVRRLRVSRSLPLLANAGIALSDVAYRCGFADQSHFTRTFRALTGVTPGAYRNL